MKRLALILAGLIGTAAAGIAQSPNSASWPPAVGVRARIASPAVGVERQIGTIESVSTDTLKFRLADDGNLISIKPSEIKSIEVSAGTHTAKAKWAAIGFLVGAGAGAGIASATYKQCRDSFKCIGDIGGRKGSVGMGAIAGALAGGMAGVLWGARRHEDWTPMTR